MRSAILLALLLILAADVCPQSSPTAFTLREGLAATVILKACDKLTTASVDFDGSGSLYGMEWWRCGPKTPDWDLGEFPIHYLLIRPPKDKPQAFPLTLSNSGTSDEYFIDDVQLFSIAASRRQLLHITGKYYRANQDSIQCFLERVDDEFQCAAFNEQRYSAKELPAHEKRFLRKAVEYLQGR